MMGEMLLAGHLRYRAGMTSDERESLRRLARDGQRPRALFIGCADSRVIPELLTGARPGDLFVVRNIANRVPAWSERDDGVAAAVEYAIEQLEVPEVIVCGHDGCGGVSAILDGGSPGPSRTRLDRWLLGLQPVVARARAAGGSRDVQLRRAVEANVVDGLAQLSMYPSLARRGSAAPVRVHGWVYDLVEAAVRVYDPAVDAFVEPA